MNTPLVAVDAVIFYQNGIVLIRRKNPPFKGGYALPGGFVEVGESTEDAIRREVEEETGLKIEILGLVGVYSDPQRDPRGHVISICYLAKGKGELASGSDAKTADVFDPESLPPLAFDHARIIRDALSLYNSYHEGSV